MKTLEFTEEQKEMIANCILSQIQASRKMLNDTYNPRIADVIREEQVKLLTLLNYINS
jgi:hypothetical protein